MFEPGFLSKLCSYVISRLVFCGSSHVITTFGKRQSGTTNKQVSMLIWNSISEYLKTMEGDQSKNSVCYLEISYSTLDSVSLLILNISNVLL